MKDRRNRLSHHATSAACKLGATGFQPVWTIPLGRSRDLPRGLAFDAQVVSRMATPAAASHLATEDTRAFGKPLLATVEWVGDLGFFCWRVARAMFSRPFEGAEFLRQLDAIGARSLPLIALAGAATGVVLSLQTRDSLTRFGAKSLLPAVIVFSLIKETGPIITGLIASGRIGRRDRSGTGLHARHRTNRRDGSVGGRSAQISGSDAGTGLHRGAAFAHSGGRFLWRSHGLGGDHAGGAHVLEAVSFKRPSRRHIRRSSSAHPEDRCFRLDHRNRSPAFKACAPAAAPREWAVPPPARWCSRHCSSSWRTYCWFD